MDSTAPASSGRKNSLMTCLPLAVFVGWWIYSLQFQWRAQEEYRFGYLVVVLVAFLVWDRWDSRPQGDIPVATWRAWGWSLIGFPLVLVAELYRYALARSPASATALRLGTLGDLRECGVAKSPRHSGAAAGQRDSVAQLPRGCG